MTFFGVFLMLIVSSIVNAGIKTTESKQDKEGGGIEIEAVEGKSVSLPCDVKPRLGHDKVYMVFWFRQGVGFPIYTFDMRGKAMSEASRWSAPQTFGTRANFRTDIDPAELIIQEVKRHDEGVYRCRVDFRNAQTKSLKFNLTVVVPPEPPIILDKWGRHLNGSVGPYHVGNDILLTCRAVGGHPQPKVRWLMNSIIVDDQFEHDSGDVIENKLTWISVSRKDLGANFTCQAENTKLIPSRNKSVILDLFLKPLTVEIRKTDLPLVADKRYEVSCESAGSRPSAIITWYKGKRQLRRTKEEIQTNLTISELSFVPTTEDHGKSITCRAENPNVTGSFMETSWIINVVYPPIVGLTLGKTLNASDIKEGDDVYFECKVTANPPMRRLTWLFNDELLPYLKTNGIIHSNQSLVIQKVTKNNAGIYRCSAVNSEGETISDELNFRVQFAPICKTDKSIPVGASRGETINIICEVDSDPPVKTYKWKFNNSGESLDLETDRFAKTSNGTISILKYTPITELEYGTLSCWGSNDVGHQINPCLFQIVAASKPMPVRNCTLTNQTSNSVEVFCLPGFDGGLPQTFFMEVFKKNSAQKASYNITVEFEPYFRLDNLETDVTFKIVIYAQNSKGRSLGVVLEEITFTDAEKRTAMDTAYLIISPILGIFIGGFFTILMIILIIVIKFYKKNHHNNHHHRPTHHQQILEEKFPVSNNCAGQNINNTIASTKPLLLRSASPREFFDPDIIPAKYGAAATDESFLINNSKSQYTLASSTNNTWNDDGLLSIQKNDSSSSLLIGTFPRDSSIRPKDLYLGHHHAKKITSDEEEINGLAIKERLMANRLPESCV